MIVCARNKAGEIKRKRAETYVVKGGIIKGLNIIKLFFSWMVSKKEKEASLSQSRI